MADTARPYPSGVYRPGDGPPDSAELSRDQSAGSDPSWLSGAYLEMSERWQPIKVMMGGTQAFRANAEILLPIEPREDTAAWKRRVSHAVLSPFTMRIAEQAAGLILRKPIQLEPKEEDGQVDEYWETWIENVGYGTSLTSLRAMLNSPLPATAPLDDFPSTEPAENLLQERQLGRGRIAEVRADQILACGGRHAVGTINQIRINEYVEELWAVCHEGYPSTKQNGGWSLWRRVKTAGSSTKKVRPACL